MFRRQCSSNFSNEICQLFYSQKFLKVEFFSPETFFIFNKNAWQGIRQTCWRRLLDTTSSTTCKSSWKQQSCFFLWKNILTHQMKVQISTYLLCPGFLTKEKCKINKKTYLGQTNANAASNEESIRMKNDKITCLLCKLSHYTFLMVYQVGDLHIPDKKSTIILIYWCILGNYSSKMRVFTHFSIILASLLC